MKDSPVPYGKIEGPERIGEVIRGRRKELSATQAKAAGLAGVGQRFMSELERGKPTVELGKVLKVLSRLGLDVYIVPRGRLPETGRQNDSI